MTKAKKNQTKPQEEDWDEIGSGWDEIQLLEEPGDEIVGAYIDTIPEIGKNKSNVHVLTVGEDRVGIWGSSLLDTRLEKVEKGQIVKVIFVNLETNEKSGREYKNYNVFVKRAK